MVEVSETFAHASPSSGKYFYVHPHSDLGDPNVADRRGFELVTITADGFPVYKAKESSNFGFARVLKYGMAFVVVLMLGYFAGVLHPPDDVIVTQVKSLTR